MGENKKMSYIFEQILPIISFLESEQSIENRNLLDKIYVDLLKKLEEFIYSL